MIIIMVRNMNYNGNIYTICYDTLNIFNSKADAKKFYSECYHMSEGAEQERYASILVDLNFSNTGKDNVSNYCNKISIKLKEFEDKFINMDLEKNLSIDNVIRYYEEKIEPILEVSKIYDVDFSRRIPFEKFGSDEDSYVMFSFSDYYRELLDKFNIDTTNIYTRDFSDGQYILKINDKEFDIRAWDNIKSVMDNMESIIEYFKQDEMEIEY